VANRAVIPALLATPSYKRTPEKIKFGIRFVFEKFSGRFMGGVLTS
jgi:hypothetical protein